MAPYDNLLECQDTSHFARQKSKAVIKYEDLILDSQITFDMIQIF
jgi:hypothetical protein